MTFNNLGPPGGTDDESGPLGPAAAEKVATTPPITITASRSPSGRGTADYMAAGRREGGKTPRQR
jgi:hypothetical protein